MCQLTRKYTGQQNSNFSLERAFQKFIQLWSTITNIRNAFQVEICSNLPLHAKVPAAWHVPYTDKSTHRIEMVQRNGALFSTVD